MSLTTVATEAEIWERAIQPGEGNLPSPTARALMELKLAPEDISRINLLSQRAQEGSLSELEERELDSYLSVGRAIELLKAKARNSLGASPD